MGKKKEKEGFAVSQRSKAITGLLKCCGIRVTISPEKPEDWAIIRGYYPAFKENLFKDMYPFMQAGLSAIQPKKTINQSKQSLIDLLKLQAALLNGFLRRIKSGDLKRLPSLKKAIEAVDDIAFIQLPESKKIDTKAFTKHIIETVYSDTILHNKLKGYKKEGGFDSDNFNLSYIKAGEDIFKNGMEHELLSSSYSILYLMNIDKFATITNEPFFKLLYNLIKSIHIRYRGYIDPSEIVSSIKNPDELDLMKSIIIKAFPAITLP